MTKFTESAENLINKFDNVSNELCRYIAEFAWKFGESKKCKNGEEFRVFTLHWDKFPKEIIIEGENYGSFLYDYREDKLDLNNISDLYELSNNCADSLGIGISACDDIINQIYFNERKYYNEYERDDRYWNNIRLNVQNELTIAFGIDNSLKIMDDEIVKFVGDYLYNNSDWRKTNDIKREYIKDGITNYIISKK